MWRVWGEERRIQGNGGNLRNEWVHWGDPGVEGKIILRWILECRMWGYGLDAAGSGQGHVTGTCE
jgi:hypothetical protein